MSFLTSAIKDRGFGKGLIDLPKDYSPWSVTLVLILLAYLLSFWVRLEWIDYAQANYTNEQGEAVFLRPNMVKEGVALPNTHDSFYFGSIVQKAALGMHKENSLLPGVYQNGMITALPYWLITLFSFIQVWLLFKMKSIPKSKIRFDIKSTLNVVFSILIGAAIFIIGARGGLQLKPIKSINAGELSGSQNASLILNTPFSILHSFKNKGLKPYNYFNNEKLNKIYSPIHSGNVEALNKKNIVILILESYSKEFVGFYNNGNGYTPFLDSLMQYGLVFNNAYANGLKSIEALPAITASIPTLMNNPFITSQYAQNKFGSLASLLNKEGYNTSFYHGGNRGTMGFYSFSKKAGFTDYFGMEEYDNNFDFDGHPSIFQTNEQTRTSDDYFLNSGGNISYFFEKDAFDQKGNLKRDLFHSLN